MTFRGWPVEALECFLRTRMDLLVLGASSGPALFANQRDGVLKIAVTP